MAKKRFSSGQKKHLAIIFVILVFFVVDFIVFLFLSPILAGVLLGIGVLVILFGVFIGLSREPLHKDVERLKRETDRRAHFPAFGVSPGVLFLEDGEPTKSTQNDEDY